MKQKLKRIIARKLTNPESYQISPVLMWGIIQTVRSSADLIAKNGTLKDILINTIFGIIMWYLTSWGACKALNKIW